MSEDNFAISFWRDLGNGSAVSIIFLPASFFKSSINVITSCILSWPNFIASSICFSVRRSAWDSTIITDSFVPATTKSNLLFSSISFEGFKTNSSFINPTFEAAAISWYGAPDIASAALAPIIASTSTACLGS